MIDLDLAPPPSEPAARPPLLARVRAELTLPRPFLVAVVAVVTLLTLGAAVPPAPVLTEVMAVGGTAASAFVLGPNALYTAMFGTTPNSQAGIRRYALADGVVLWAAEVRQNVQNLEVSEPAQVLMARSGGSPDITFLDTADGKVLWRSTSPNTSVRRMADTTVLLLTTGDDSDELRVADLRSGRTVWSHRIDGTGLLRIDDRAYGPPERIVDVTAAGRATVRGFADGATRATADLGVRLGPGGELGTTSEVTLIRDRLHVIAPTGGGMSLATYDADTLAPLWQVVVPPGRVEGCGEVVCLVTADSVTALDAGDGHALWSSPDIGFASSLGVGERLDADNRLIGFGPPQDGQQLPTAVLLDPRDGHVLARLGQSVDVGRFLLRADTEVPGRAWVAAPDPDGGFRTTGGFETLAPYGCSALGSYLACPTSAGPTAVWRIPAR